MNYDVAEFIEARLDQRFPEWVLGYYVWREYGARLDSWQSFDNFQDAIARVRAEQRPNGADPHGVTRIFISHKKENRDEALRVAWLAQQEGHYYWLDILEPTLQGGLLTPLQIAGVIEIALLNCTHVIALITPESVKSRWIPYEYGRAKEPSPYALNAASWLHPTQRKSFPEYLYLGVITGSEQDIRWWLQAAPTGGTGSWLGKEPPALP
jgi:TIR domain